MKKLFFSFIFCSRVCFGQADVQKGLMAWYPFSGNAKDESGNNNHPVFNNAALTADRFGNAKSAYHFNGRSAYMKILNSPTLNTYNKLSISAWVRPQGFYNGKCHGNSILMKGDADYLKGNYLLRYDDGPYTGYENCNYPLDRQHQNFYGVGAHSSPPGYTPYIKTNQWYCVTVTYDGKTARLYIDGRYITGNPQLGATFTNNYDVFIGRHNSRDYPYWFNGDLDDVRIYNRALSKEEISDLCKKTPEVEPVEIKKPAYVKVKTDKDIAKQKPADTKPKTAKESIPLIKMNEPVDINPVFVEPLNFDAEKEIVLEKRKNELAKEIMVDRDSIAVTLYDNGIIDGDSITLIYNDKILATHLLLTEKPITFYIKIAPGSSRNELLMYAENLGSIPPNTALMVIYDGNKRYELNISSSKTTNGVVSFKLRE